MVWISISWLAFKIFASHLAQVHFRCVNYSLCVSHFCSLVYLRTFPEWEYFRSAFVGLPIFFNSFNFFSFLIIDPTSWLVDNGDCATKNDHFNISGKWNLERGFITTRADWNERLSNWLDIHGLLRNRVCRQFGVSRKLIESPFVFLRICIPQQVSRWRHVCGLLEDYQRELSSLKNGQLHDCCSLHISDLIIVFMA